MSQRVTFPFFILVTRKELIEIQSEDMLILSVLIAYFAVLMLVSRLVSRRKDVGNDGFFMAGRNASWWVVSIGMIGASVSGVSFLSVPGMVGSIGFKYLQTVSGFILGYILIAKILLPVYYGLSSPSIYEFLNERFGRCTYKTGAWFFLVSKLLGTAAKVYVVAIVLYSLAFEQLGISFFATVVAIVVLIWLYTRHGGMNTIVWTDLLQTVLMVIALVAIIGFFVAELGLDFGGLVDLLANSQWSQYVELDDWSSKQHFAKQFFSGVFIALVMTGLDQDMIQKNRAIRTLEQSQKNMYWYGSAFLPLNFLFLLLGLLMLQYAGVNGIELPARGDEYLSFFMKEGYFGAFVSVCFVVGVVSATFSSADSSLTSLTTSFCVDIAGRKDDVHFRKWVHVVFCVILVAVILLIHKVNDNALIDLIYIIVSYTYGPLLGLFAFGLFTHKKTCDKAVPFIASLSPVLCFVIEWLTKSAFGYFFGYELLMLNGAITYLGLFLAKGSAEEGG